MKAMTDKFKQQFVALEAQLKKVQETRRKEYSSYSHETSIRVDKHLKLAWEVKAKHLLQTVCGPESQHFMHFEEAAKGGMFLSSSDILEEMGTVFLAAKEDFEDGMFDDIRRLVRADVLDDFLSQAEALHTNKFYEASISLGGAVLEDTLRKLCDKHTPPITYDKKKTSIEALNVSLVKAEVYDGLVQKRITHLAQLRNDADHGRSLGKVKPADAADMLRWLRGFVTDYLN